MFLFALLGKFAVKVLIKKCSPLTYIIFWLFSCACFNWHRAYRSFDGLVLLARQQQQQQHRCFLESILIVVAELSVSPPCYHINADLLLIGLPTATLWLVFFFECAKLFLFLKLLILLFTFDSGKKSRRLSIRFKRLSMVEIPRYSLHLPKMLLANIFSLFAWIQHATRLISSLLIAYHFSDFKNVLGECADCP